MRTRVSGWMHRKEGEHRQSRAYNHAWLTSTISFDIGFDCTGWPAAQPVAFALLLVAEVDVLAPAPVSFTPAAVFGPPEPEAAACGSALDFVCGCEGANAPLVDVPDPTPLPPMPLTPALAPAPVIPEIAVDAVAVFCFVSLGCLAAAADGASWLALAAVGAAGRCLAGCCGWPEALDAIATKSMEPGVRCRNIVEHKKVDG